MINGATDLLGEKLEASRRRLVKLSFWIFLSSSALFGILYVMTASYAEAAGVFTVGLCTLGIPVLLKHSETSLGAAYLVVILFFSLLNFIVFVTDGLRSDTLHWLVLVPVFAQVLIGRSAARTWLQVLILEMAVLFGLEMINFFNAADVPNLGGSIFRAVGISVLFAVGYGIVSSFERNVRLILAEVERSRIELDEAREASEARASLIQSNASIVSDSTRGVLHELSSGAEAMEKLKKEINDIDEAARQMVTFVAEAVAQAQKMQATITGLQEQTKKIQRVLDIVGTISTQTNLLALNASVEASRAGAAGSGFQVVATEVKLLAGKSKEAIADIDVVIRSLNSQMAQTVNDVKASAAKIEKVTVAQAEISSSLIQQQNASAEVMQNLHMAREMSQQLSTRVQALTAGL